MAGQRKLKAASVFLNGAGGLGSPLLFNGGELSSLSSLGSSAQRL